MRWLLLLLLLLLALVGCSSPPPEEPAPEPTRILFEPAPTRAPRIPQPVVTPDILMRDPPPAQEFDPEPLGDLSVLLPGRWQLVPDAKKRRELQRAMDFLAQHPDRPEAANVVAALETVMAMELRVHKGTLRFSMPVAQAAHPYTVLRDDDPDLDIELQGPKGKKEAIHFVFEARDRIVLERGRDHLTFERL